jgi:hypothetical protein
VEEYVLVDVVATDEAVPFGFGTDDNKFVIKLKTNLPLRTLNHLIVPVMERPLTI